MVKESETVRFGIIGCGYIAKRHAQHIVANPYARLVSLYDVVPKRAVELAEEYDARVATDLNDLLHTEEVDVISVCTPNGLHFQHALAALEANLHALVEKPLTLTSADAQRLIDEAERRQREIFVVKQNRFNAPVQALKRLIEDGRLGRIFMVAVNCYWNRNDAYYNGSNWKGTKALDGGTLYTQFSHFVDIFYYLFGDVYDIAGTVTNANHESLIEFEDTGVFTFRFQNGALGSFNFTTNSFEKNMEGSIVVFAESGTVKLGGQYLNKIDYQRTNGFDITNLPETGPSNQYGYYQGSMSNHDKVINNVVETLRGRESAMTNAVDGKKVVDIIERMYGAAKTV